MRASSESGGSALLQCSHVGLRSSMLLSRRLIGQVYQRRENRLGSSLFRSGPNLVRLLVTPQSPCLVGMKTVHPPLCAASIGNLVRSAIPVGKRVPLSHGRVPLHSRSRVASALSHHCIVGLYAPAAEPARH